MPLEIAGVQYYSTATVLEQAAISRQTLWRWRRQGVIPEGHRFRNGQVLFSEGELCEILRHADRVEPDALSGGMATWSARQVMVPPPSSTPREIYLDNNATTRPLPEVVDAVARAMADGYGNASSVHAAGGRARRYLHTARERVAAALNVGPDDVVFTGGATEANNIVLNSLLGRDPIADRLVTTAVEHSSILAAARHLRVRGVEVVVLPVDADGTLAPGTLEKAILPGRTLVSVQWASNETGVLQPIGELAQAARARGALFHTDAVQAVGKIPTDLELTPVDLLSLSGHKLHGPVGVGALVGPGVHGLRPMAFGGSQESSLRPGTENVPAIVGLGEALRIRATRFSAVAKRTRQLRDLLETRLAERRLVAAINGGSAPRLPNTTNVRFADVDGEALTLRLDKLGVRCSQSSACSNHRPEPSYVLRAMGLSERDAYASVRFAFSELNSADEVEATAEAITEIHASLVRFAVA